jgi:hypothetical protein
MKKDNQNLNKFTSDFIVSSRGQLDYPGMNTLIPNANGSITMKGVKQNVLGIDDLGNKKIMKPKGEYQFPGNSVYEIPLKKKGGEFKKGLVSNPKKTKKSLASKKYSRSLSATNILFTENSLFKKPKSRKNKVYNPNAKYYAEGGDTGCPNGQVWSKKDKRCIDLPVFGNSLNSEPFTKSTNLNDALDIKPLNSFSDFGKIKPKKIPVVEDSFLETLEKDINDFLENPLKKAAQVSESLKEKGEDPSDALRHSTAGALTAQTIANKTGNIPFISNPLGYLGANIAGIGHELSTLSQAYLDDRPWSVKLQESLEDIYNNSAGANTIFSNKSEKDKINYLLKLTRENKLPDGYGEERPFRDNPKWTDPYNQKQYGGINKFDDGGTIYNVKGSKGNYKKINGKWHVDWNRSGNYQPLSKGDVKARTAVLDKMAKPLYDKDYDEMLAYKNLSTDDKINKFEPKKELTKEELKNISDRLGRDYKPEDTKLQSVEMVYPEKYIIGPGAGAVGLGSTIARNAAGLGIKGINKAMSYIPAPVLGGLNAYGLYQGTKEFSDPNSLTRKSISRSYDNPTGSNIGDAAFNVGMNSLNFVGLPFGKAFKGLKKNILNDEYISGLNKIKPGINKFSQNKILLDKSLVKTAGELPESLVTRRIESFTTPIKRKQSIKTTEDLRKTLKADLYRINKLKKENPGIDINNPNLNSYSFEKGEIEKIPEFLKGIEQNKISTEAFGKRFAEQYADKMSLINKSDPVFQNIAKESPQYIDEIVAHLKNPNKSNENFLNDLVIQSNTFARFQKGNKVSDRLIGKSFGRKGSTMDVEGITPSDYYGNEGFRVQPTIDRAQEIFQTPLAEKWSKRIPEFKSDVVLHSDGMHDSFHPDYIDFLNKRRTRLDSKMGSQYGMLESGEKLDNTNVHGSSDFELFGNHNTNANQLQFQLNSFIPNNITKSKYFKQPKHLVFESPTYGAPLENFEALYMGKLKGGDYQKFFEGTSKGFKDGGENNDYVELNLTPEEIQKYIDAGYIVEEIN